MSYVINNSRGNVIAVVADGTINTSATSLALVGRGVSSYGSYENENYVYLLENFANISPPTNAVLGQLWYNSATDILCVYNSANAWGELASQEYVQAQKISPAFTGIPTAPTAAPGTATTQLATTAFVTSSPAFAGVPTAPTAAPGTATTQLATTAFVTSSPAFAGAPTAPTAASGTANTQLATTAFVTSSPAFAGTPTAPTAAPGTATDQIATTGFVQGEKVSPAFLGTPTAPTAPYGANDTRIATTGFVQGEKFSPAFTGAPTAPTATSGTANTQIATTAFVAQAVSTGPGSILGTIALQNANAVAITGGSITGITALALADGGTGASSASGARTNLGLGSMSQQNDSAVNITGGSIVGIVDLSILDGGTGASSAAGARTNLGLGSMATQNSTAVAITGGSITGTAVTTASATITGGSITGITDLAIADGGTGASSAAGARSNLGIGTLALQNDDSVAITGGILSNVTLSGTATISGGTITGITDLAIADGGTGASTAAAALTNLGAVPITRTVSAGGGLTGGGALSANITLAIAANSNGYGTRYVSTLGPTGGVDGDIWYQI